MSVDLKTLINPSDLKLHCQSLSIVELEKAHAELKLLISDRRLSFRESELKRKGERTLNDMRGLMAKAGVSMSEFQAALERL